MNGMVMSGALPPVVALLPALVVSTTEAAPPAPVCPATELGGLASLVAAFEEQLDVTSTSEMARMVPASAVDALL